MAKMKNQVFGDAKPDEVLVWRRSTGFGLSSFGLSRGSGRLLSETARYFYAILRADETELVNDINVYSRTGGIANTLGYPPAGVFAIMRTYIFY